MSGLRPHIVRCAAERCQTVVEPGHLMCRAHWFSVDAGLRREIWEAFRAKRMGQYQAAVARAIDAISAREGVYRGIFETRSRDAGAAGSPKHTHTAAPALPLPDHLRRKAIAKAYAAGEPVRMIAWDYGISKSRVCGIAREHGLPRRLVRKVAA